MDQPVYENVVLRHYGKADVQKEIARYSQGRWVAVHCESLNPQGYPILLRYRAGVGKPDKVPLAVQEPEEIPLLLKRFVRLRPRTFYASASIYMELSRSEQVKDLANILGCTPTWDIDNDPENWKATVEAAKEIMSFLQEQGVTKSVFLKWSGRGAHVHLHQRSLSPGLLQKIRPLDAAFAIVEYTNQSLSSRFAEIKKKHNAQKLSVENEIDLQRVFSSPLSLHRTLDRVVVCISPSSIGDFTPDWTRVDNYRHWTEWDQFLEAEADTLAETAYRKTGGYPAKTRPKPKPKLKHRNDSILKWLKP